MRKKAFEINDIQVLLDEKKNGGKGMTEINALCNALYVSAKGSNHYYEALELICSVTNEKEYHKELERLKAKYI